MTYVVPFLNKLLGRYPWKDFTPPNNPFNEYLKNYLSYQLESFWRILNWIHSERLLNQQLTYCPESYHCFQWSKDKWSWNMIQIVNYLFDRMSKKTDPPWVMAWQGCSEGLQRIWSWAGMAAETQNPSRFWLTRYQLYPSSHNRKWAVLEWGGAKPVSIEISQSFYLIKNITE